MLIPPGEIALSLGCWLAGKAPLCGSGREKDSAARGQDSPQVKSLDLPGSRTRPWKWEHLSAPDPVQSQAWGSEGERPGTQGPGVGGLWDPVPALLCPQPSPLWPRRFAVSGAGAPGVICAPGWALPSPGRRAAPALSDAGLARAEPTSPGTRDSQWIFPLIPLLPWGPFPKLSLLLPLGLPS